MKPKVTKTKRGQTTRRRIVEQAASAFNRHGYAGTSMSELMSATGLEKGGLYRHFASKEDLAAAAFDYAWETVNEPRRRGIENCVTALEKLLLLLQNFVEQPPRTVPGGCPLLNAAIDADDGNQVLRGKAKSALNHWRNALEAIVVEGQKAGELRDDIDPSATATILIATLEGAVMMSRLDRTREPLFAVGKHLADYLQSLRR